MDFTKELNLVLKEEFPIEGHATFKYGKYMAARRPSGILAIVKNELEGEVWAMSQVDKEDKLRLLPHITSVFKKHHLKKGETGGLEETLRAWYRHSDLATLTLV